MNPEVIAARVASVLTDDLRWNKWRGHHNHLAGHCKTASEVCGIILGTDWLPEIVAHEGTQHWYLRNQLSGDILDPTVGQFLTQPDYEQGTSTVFSTAVSPAARTILARLIDPSWSTTLGDAPEDESSAQDAPVVGA